MKEALFIVDMLNDFVRKDGNLYVPGAEDIIHNIDRLRHSFLERGNFVIYTNDSHSKWDAEFDNFPQHCLTNEEGAEIIDELKPLGYDNEIIFTKQEFDAFSNPELDPFCKRHNIVNVYITGVAVEYCIYETAYSAMDSMLYVRLVTDAISGVGRVYDADAKVMPETLGFMEKRLMQMAHAHIDWTETDFCWRKPLTGFIE